MKDAYSDDLTLNRRDNDGMYCKENCKWDTKNFQGHMRRKQKNTMFKYIGLVLASNDVFIEAKIKVNECAVYLGTYKTEENAAKAYDDASEMFYGDRPNKTEKKDDEIYEKVKKIMDKTLDKQQIFMYNLQQLFGRGFLLQGARVCYQALSTLYYRKQQGFMSRWQNRYATIF